MSPVVLAVGTFDGVHLGHRRLLAAAHDLATAAGLELVALTLDRHPLALLHPERAPRLLTGLDHKRALLRAVDGVGRVEVLRFDRARADQSPESFVVDTIVGDLAAEVLVVGGNFRFGRAGAGDVALARHVGEAVGLSVVGIPLLEASPGVVVSSSAIRRLVVAGHLDRAADLLGRPHEVRGVLGPAGGRAPAAGARTDDGPAEIAIGLVVAPELLLPPVGIYEARVARLAGPVDGGAGEAPALVRARVVADPARPPGAAALDPAVVLEPPRAGGLAPWWARADGIDASVAFLAPAAPAPADPAADGPGVRARGASAEPADR